MATLWYRQFHGNEQMDRGSVQQIDARGIRVITDAKHRSKESITAHFP